MDPAMKLAVLNDIGAAIEGDTVGGEVVDAVEIANESNDFSLLVTAQSLIYRVSVTLHTPLS